MSYGHYASRNTVPEELSDIERSILELLKSKKPKSEFGIATSPVKVQTLVNKFKDSAESTIRSTVTSLKQQKLITATPTGKGAEETLEISEAGITQLEALQPSK